MNELNFEIAISINGTSESFVFGVEKRNKVVTDNIEEAVRLFNQQWNILAKYSTTELFGEVVLTLDQITPCRPVGSWANLKTAQFALTRSLLRELV